MTTPSIGPVCEYCGLLLEGDDWARDNEGAYHWECVPPPREIKRIRGEVEALKTSHFQHRTSDQSFLRSLGKLTEALQALEQRVVTIERAHGILCASDIEGDEDGTSGA